MRRNMMPKNSKTNGSFDVIAITSHVTVVLAVNHIRLMFFPTSPL